MLPAALEAVAQAVLDLGTADSSFAEAVRHHRDGVSALPALWERRGGASRAASWQPATHADCSRAQSPEPPAPRHVLAAAQATARVHIASDGGIVPVFWGPTTDYTSLHLPLPHRRSHAESQSGSEVAPMQRGAPSPDLARHDSAVSRTTLRELLAMDPAEQQQHSELLRSAPHLQHIVSDGSAARAPSLPQPSACESGRERMPGALMRHESSRKASTSSDAHPAPHVDPPSCTLRSAEFSVIGCNSLTPIGPPAPSGAAADATQPAKPAVRSFVPQQAEALTISPPESVTPPALGSTAASYERKDVKRKVGRTPLCRHSKTKGAHATGRLESSAALSTLSDGSFLDVVCESAFDTSQGVTSVCSCFCSSRLTLT
jgi:hypothetical protein